MMNEGKIDTKSLKERLVKSGLDEIFSFYLREQKDGQGNPKRLKVNDFITGIDLEIALEPLDGWKRQIGMFYENTKYSDETGWEVKTLQNLFGKDNILSYFMSREPDFRLCNEDSLLVLRSVTEYLSQITKAGIQVRNIAEKQYNPSIIEEVTRITRKIELKPYIIGKDHLER